MITPSLLVSFLLAATPDLSSARQLLADGDAARAEEAFRALLAKDESPPVVAGLAGALLALGRRAEAMQLCDEQLKRTPDAVEVKQARDQVEAVTASKSDVSPPVIGHDPVGRWSPGVAITLGATIEDASGVFQPMAYYRPRGSRAFVPVGLVGKGDGYSATLSPSSVDLEYYLEAFDKEGNGPARAGTPAMPLLIRIAPPELPRLSAPPADAPRIITATPAVAPVPEPALEQAAPSRPSSVTRPLGYAALAGGVVAAVIGTVLGSKAYGAAGDWRAARDPAGWSSARDSAGSAATGATISWATAGVLGAAGTGLLLSSFLSSGPEATSPDPATKE